VATWSQLKLNEFDFLAEGRNVLIMWNFAAGERGSVFLQLRSYGGTLWLVAWTFGE
jgi:hypothetical protein